MGVWNGLLVDFYFKPIRFGGNATERCPHCGDDMIRLRRERTGSHSWTWVWMCLTCRRETRVKEKTE